MHPLIEQKKVFLFDLDGTLYLGNRVLPGALRLIMELRKRKKQIFFFTNNSSRSQNQYLQKLTQMGFQAKADEIVMSTHSLIRFLKMKKLRRIFLLGTPAMKRMLKNAGIEHDVKKPQAVVVGFDKTLTYQKLLKASRLVHSGLPYVVTHPDYFCPTEEGPEPDCGSFALVIEKTTKKKPMAVLGKPHPLMIEEVKFRAKVKKSEMILFGDRVETDLYMGNRSKIDTVLVLSGDSSRKDLQRSGLKVSYVFKSVKDLLK